MRFGWPRRRFLATSLVMGAMATLFFSADLVQAAAAKKAQVTWTTPASIRRKVVPGQTYQMTLNYRISGTTDIDQAQSSVQPQIVDPNTLNPVFQLSEAVGGCPGTLSACSFTNNLDYANIQANATINQLVISVTIPMTPTRRSYNTTVRVKENITGDPNAKLLRTLNRPLSVNNTITYTAWKRLNPTPTSRPTSTPTP